MLRALRDDRPRARLSGRGRIWARLAAAPVLALAGGCGAADYGDPGPSWGGFEYTDRGFERATQIIVVVVDDRTTGVATDLRADIGAAVSHIGGNRLGLDRLLSPDPAVWHPVDYRIVLVPASSASIDAVASPATNAALAWTTNQATQAGRDVWVRAVSDEVSRMTAPLGATFRPLERARDVVRLLQGKREATGEAEMAFIASAASNLRSFIFVSIVTTSDDESPEPIAAYDLDMPVSVVTQDGQGRARLDPVRFPRFSAWAMGSTEGSMTGYHDDVDPPWALFGEFCVDFRLWCDHRPIAEISPGIGRCDIEITTVEPPRCDASRGWADPKGADGVRRPRTNTKGEHVCEVLPVAAEFMDACIHDPTCAECGNGWCVSEVRPRARSCPATPPKVLRWVGGVLPEPGSIHVTCIEPQ